MCQGLFTWWILKSVVLWKPVFCCKSFWLYFLFLFFFHTNISKQVMVSLSRLLCFHRMWSIELWNVLTRLLVRCVELAGGQDIEQVCNSCEKISDLTRATQFASSTDSLCQYRYNRELWESYFPCSPICKKRIALILLIHPHLCLWLELTFRVQGAVFDVHFYRDLDMTIEISLQTNFVYMGKYL